MSLRGPNPPLSLEEDETQPETPGFYLTKHSLGATGSAVAPREAHCHCHCRYSTARGFSTLEDFPELNIGTKESYTLPT